MSDLINNIESWLTSHGYPLEMEVAATFRRHAFNVNQSYVFLDAETDEPREIDIVAPRRFSVEQISAGVTYVVECKLARQKKPAFPKGAVALAA